MLLKPFSAPDRTRRRRPGARHNLPTYVPATSGGPTGHNGGPSPGARVRYFGDYEIEGELARAAWVLSSAPGRYSLNRTIALKMILAGQLADESDVKRFYTEAEVALRSLDHPADRADLRDRSARGAAFLFVWHSWRGGASLKQLVDFTDATPRGSGSCSRWPAGGSRRAAAAGMIHRDIKPANILPSGKGRPRRD